MTRFAFALVCSALIPHCLVAGPTLPDVNLVVSSETEEQTTPSEQLPKTTQQVEEQRNIRIRAIKNVAKSFGNQSGLYEEYERIQERVEAIRPSLDKILSFSKFIIDGMILCPVVEESERVFHQLNDKKIRTVNKTYSISHAARIVAQPPTWSDYIIRSVQPPQPVHNVMLPRNDTERQAFNQAFSEGYESGVEQAQEIFTHDIRELDRILTGMYRFRILAEQNIVTLPRLNTTTNEVVHLNNGKELHVKDVVYEISNDSIFDESTKWTPYFRFEGSEQ